VGEHGAFRRLPCARCNAEWSVDTRRLPAYRPVGKNLGGEGARRSGGPLPGPHPGPALPAPGGFPAGPGTGMVPQQRIANPLLYPVNAAAVDMTLTGWTGFRAWPGPGPAWAGRAGKGRARARGNVSGRPGCLGLNCRGGVLAALMPRRVTGSSPSAA
jgi:hypothetical protein